MELNSFSKWDVRMWEMFICFSVGFFELRIEFFMFLKMQLTFEFGMAIIRSTINAILFGVPRYEGSDRDLLNPLTQELNLSAQRCLTRFLLLGILIFKGLTARRLYLSFGVKGLM
jgi:hypothetical protein